MSRDRVFMANPREIKRAATMSNGLITVKTAARAGADVVLHRAIVSDVDRTDFVQHELRRRQYAVLHHHLCGAARLRWAQPGGGQAQQAWVSSISARLGALVLRNESNGRQDMTCANAVAGQVRRKQLCERGMQVGRGRNVPIIKS